MKFESNGTVGSTNVTWLKLPGRGKFYTNGFNSGLSSNALSPYCLWGTRYTPSTAASNRLGWTEGLTFEADLGLSNALTAGIAFDPTNNRFVVDRQNTNKLTLGLDAATGVFGGSFRVNRRRGATMFRGVVLDAIAPIQSVVGVGFGFYLGTNAESRPVEILTP
jgi:hypothetical protein